MVNSKIKKLAYIDILRASAILGVLMVHASLNLGVLRPIVNSVASYGQMGVQLFFVTSAITLCLSAVERHENSYTNFFIRRLFRIAPLYYFGIIFYFVWRGAIASFDAGRLAAPDGYSWLAVLQNIFFVHGFSVENYNSIVPGGWSISVEMTFYLMFPLLFTLQRRISTGVFCTLVVAVVIAACGIELVLTRQLGKPNDSFGFIYASFFNQLPIFMIGLLTFKMLGRKVGPELIIVAVGFMLAALYIQNNRTHDTGFDGLIYALLSAAAFGIIAVRLSYATIPVNFWASLLQRVGQNSFSMYVMHFAVLDVLHMILRPTLFRLVASPEARMAIIFPSLVVASYAVARITSKLIEEPGMQFGKKLTHR